MMQFWSFLTPALIQFFSFFCAKCNLRPNFLTWNFFSFLLRLCLLHPWKGFSILISYLYLANDLHKKEFPFLIALPGIFQEVPRTKFDKKSIVLKIEKAGEKKASRQNVWLNSRFSFTLFCLLVFQHVLCLPFIRSHHLTPRYFWWMMQLTANEKKIFWE